jgi:hypothetical protein
MASPGRNYTPKHFVRMVIVKDVHFCSQLLKTAGAPNETCRLANVLKMSNIEHFPAVESCIMCW